MCLTNVKACRWCLAALGEMGGRKSKHRSYSWEAGTNLGSPRTTQNPTQKQLRAAGLSWGEASVAVSERGVELCLCALQGSQFENPGLLLWSILICVLRADSTL